MLCMGPVFVAIVDAVNVAQRSDVLPHQRRPDELLGERLARGEMDA
jgi:hypothetical protein